MLKHIKSSEQCFVPIVILNSILFFFFDSSKQHFVHVDASPASIVDVTKLFAVTWETVTLTINKRVMNPTAISHGSIRSRWYTSHVQSTCYSKSNLH